LAHEETVQKSIKINKRKGANKSTGQKATAFALSRQKRPISRIAFVLDWK
jgi:hypothetical protein